MVCVKCVQVVRAREVALLGSVGSLVFYIYTKSLHISKSGVTYWSTNDCNTMSLINVQV